MNQDQIKEAIRNIMGLEILERSIGHLDDVSRKFRKEVQEHGEQHRVESNCHKRDLGTLDW